MSEQQNQIEFTVSIPVGHNESLNEFLEKCGGRILNKRNSPETVEVISVGDVGDKQPGNNSNQDVANKGKGVLKHSQYPDN